MLLILFGIFGFLPVLGFWMIPLGILVLLARLRLGRAGKGGEWRSGGKNDAAATA